MLNDSELDQLEKGRQRDSGWILKRIDLISTLEKYGKPMIVGSKALGVMIAKDIDISVVVQEVNTKDWQDLAKELMIAPYVRNINAIDYYNYDAQNRYDPINGQKHSLFLGINNMVGPEGDKFDTWDCDIHLVKRENSDEKEITALKNRMTPQKRLSILRLKYWANEVNKVLLGKTHGNCKITSLSIYKAVLDQNIEKIADFIVLFKGELAERFRDDFDVSVSQTRI